MILTVLIASLAGANPEPLKLATTGFQYVNISKDLATFCSEHFAQQLTLEGIRVTTSSEIGTLLGFERQRELMGCTEKSTSCIAELANALGVDGLITGTVGKFGKAYQVNIKVLSAKDGRSLSAYSGRVRDEEAILDEYTKAAKKMAPELFRKTSRAPIQQLKPVELKPQAEAAAPPPAVAPEPQVTAQVATGGKLRRYAWIPAAAGVALAGVGTVLLVDASGKARALEGSNGAPSTLTPAEAEQIRQTGPTLQTVGVLGVAVGVAAVATAGAMFFFGGPKEGPHPVAASVMVAPGQAGIVFAGAFP